MQLGIGYTNVPTVVSAASPHLRRDVEQATSVAIDKAARQAQRNVSVKIRSVGLGRLGNAVGYTSSYQKLKVATAEPYGVIYARGGDQSLAGGALEAYSRGTTIRPTGRNGDWLWIAARAIPKKVGRRRMTPALYNSSGFAASIGPLEFKPIGGGKALLVVKRVSISAKNGRAKALGKRSSRTRIPVKEVVAFTGIRVTRRAKRFDKDAEVFAVARQVPDYIARELSALRRRSA
jgi:hypothetical protein